MPQEFGPDGINIDVGRHVKGRRDQQFDIIMKSARSQVVLAALAPGHTLARKPCIVRDSDQIVYAIEGEGLVQIGPTDYRVNAGALILIPAGRPHQVTNTGTTRLLYLDFFAPPAY